MGCVGRISVSVIRRTPAGYGTRKTRLTRSTPDKPVHATPSFFCRLVEDVVYWKMSFLSG